MTLPFTCIYRSYETYRCDPYLFSCTYRAIDFAYEEEILCLDIFFDWCAGICDITNHIENSITSIPTR